MLSHLLPSAPDNTEGRQLNQVKNSIFALKLLTLDYLGLQGKSQVPPTSWIGHSLLALLDSQFLKYLKSNLRAFRGLVEFRNQTQMML